ncbi:hypothetical protein PG984_012293 [Apiospora sp. TS-2023a]
MRTAATEQPPTTDALLYKFTVPFFITLLLLLGVAPPVESTIVCPFEGGWSLRIDAINCPIDAPVNCGKGLQQRCCPPGLACAGEGDFGGNYCCKAGEDCISQASSSPQCPDPTYTLWGGNGTLDNGGFCCKPGSNGFYEGKMEGVGCTAAGVRTLPTNEYFASTVRTVACVSSASSSFPSTPIGSTPMATAAAAGSSSSSISSGTIAGIAVGAVCGVGLLACVCALLGYRRRRRDNNGHTAAPAAAAAEDYGLPDTKNQHGGQHSTHYDAAAAGTLLPAHHEQQMNASDLTGLRPPTELPNDRMRHEMANGMAPGNSHEIE